MSQQLAIDALRSEILRLQGALNILDPVKRGRPAKSQPTVGAIVPAKRRGRPPGKNATKPAGKQESRYTAAQKKAISKRVKAYWAARRKAA